MNPMKKEIRLELRTLLCAQKKIRRDRDIHIRLQSRQIAQCERSIARALKNTTREQTKITARIAILEGRLS